MSRLRKADVLRCWIAVRYWLEQEENREASTDKELEDWRETRDRLFNRVDSDALDYPTYSDNQRCEEL